jgi:hypothetical protein
LFDKNTKRMYVFECKNNLGFLQLI